MTWRDRGLVSGGDLEHTDSWVTIEMAFKEEVLRDGYPPSRKDVGLVLPFSFADLHEIWRSGFPSS